MAKLNIASVATILLLLHLVTVLAQADQPSPPPDNGTPAPSPAPWNKQSCLDLLDGKNKTNQCSNDVLKFIGAIPHADCVGSCHVSHECCIATVALDTFHPECWNFFMNKDASENSRYMLVMTCAKSFPPL